MKCTARSHKKEDVVAFDGVTNPLTEDLKQFCGEGGDLNIIPGEDEVVLEILDKDGNVIASSEFKKPTEGYHDLPDFEDGLSGVLSNILVKIAEMDDSSKTQVVQLLKKGETRTLTVRVRGYWTNQNPIPATVKFEFDDPDIPGKIIFLEPKAVSGGKVNFEGPLSIGANGVLKIKSRPNSFSYFRANLTDDKNESSSDSDIYASILGNKNGLYRYIQLGCAHFSGIKIQDDKYVLPSKDAFKAAGFENVIVTFKGVDGELKKAVGLHVQNTAEEFYLCGHGHRYDMGKVQIYIKKDGTKVYMSPDDFDGWNDNLVVFCAASCGILDIGNYNKIWLPTLGDQPGTGNPGMKWKNELVHQSNTILLGNTFQWEIRNLTIILQYFFLWRGGSKNKRIILDAWLKANATTRVWGYDDILQKWVLKPYGDYACAIDPVGKRYYFTKFDKAEPSGLSHHKRRIYEVDINDKSKLSLDFKTLVRRRIAIPASTPLPDWDYKERDTEPDEMIVFYDLSEKSLFMIGGPNEQ